MISASTIILAFRQGVRDKKMLEKLATKEVDDVGELFSLADKCVRAAEGRALHEPEALEKADASEPTSEDGANNGGKQKKEELRQPSCGSPDGCGSIGWQCSGPPGVRRQKVVPSS